jgi:hypothetical protein
MLKKLSPIGQFWKCPIPINQEGCGYQYGPILVANYWARFCEKRRPIK